MTSCTFERQQHYMKHFATDTSKSKTSILHQRILRSKSATDRRVVPSIESLYVQQGKGVPFLTTFHHGRRMDQADMYAAASRNEHEISGKLQIEAERRAYHDLNFKGKDLNGPENGRVKGKRRQFQTNFAKPPTRQILDMKVAKDQQGMWSEEHPTGLFSRVEKVVAKKWGIDLDVEWEEKKVEGRTVKTAKDGFKVTFFHGRKYDEADLKAIASLAEAQVKKEHLRVEAMARSKYSSGKFPFEIENENKAAQVKALCGFALNFPKLDKNQTIGERKVTRRLDDLSDDQLKPTTRWVAPPPGDFVCVPTRPGMSQTLAKQKDKIARKTEQHHERKEKERTRRMMEDEERAFGNAQTFDDRRHASTSRREASKVLFENNDSHDRAGVGVPGDVGNLDDRSIISRSTINIMKSELSIPMSRGSYDK
jgi:hypothetical protein